MKYIRLTKEQLEELHQEFINFLATQSITGKEWQQIKTGQPKVAEQELDIFSDLIWEGALDRAKYLLNSSSQQLFMFQLQDAQMKLILAKTTASIDLTTADGLAWLQTNINSDEVELFTATKEYSEDRNKDIFELIQQGAEISEGTLFEAISSLIA